MPSPQVNCEKNIQKDDILILVSDGVTGVMSNTEIVKFVYERFNEDETDEDDLMEEQILKEEAERKEEVKYEEGNNEQAKLVARALVNEAYKRKSKDNITALIVKFGSLLRTGKDESLLNGKSEKKDRLVSKDVQKVMRIRDMQKKSPSLITRLFKSIGKKKGIILKLGVIALFCFVISQFT